jgi:hypothetical protein
LGGFQTVPLTLDGSVEAQFHQRQDCFRLTLKFFFKKKFDHDKENTLHRSTAIAQPLSNVLVAMAAIPIAGSGSL